MDSCHFWRILYYPPQTNGASKMMMMMVNAYENVRTMSLAAAHVTCIVTISACSAVLGMAHALDGSEVQSIYIGCLASFSAHGVTATIKGNGNGVKENG